MTAMGLAANAAARLMAPTHRGLIVRTALAIMVAGAFGAVARYALQALIDPRSSGLPWGTFVINVTGSFLLGLVFTITTERLSVEPWLRTALTVGFLGAYTTFSTLAFETVRLLDGGEWFAAFLNMAGSAVVGVVAVIAGIMVARVVL